MISAADIPVKLSREERLRFAQEAYRDYRTECFWSMPREFIVTNENLPLVIEGLKLSGGHRGWRLAQRLCH
jgi:hypothetical protein